MITNVPLTALNQALVERMHMLRVHALLTKAAQSSAAAILPASDAGHPDASKAEADTDERVH